MSSTVVGDKVQKQSSMRRSRRITMTTTIAAQNAPLSSSVSAAAARGITVERISKARRTSVDGVAAIERGGPEFVVDLRRRSVEKTVCAAVGLKPNVSRELNQHRPEGVTVQFELAKSRNVGSAQLEQHNRNTGRVIRLTDRSNSRGSTQIRSATARLPAINEAKQIGLRANSLRQAIVSSKETSGEVKLSKYDADGLPLIKSSSAKTTNQPMKSFAVVSDNRSPNSLAKMNAQDGASIQSFRGLSGASKYGNSCVPMKSVYPKPEFGVMGEEAKTKRQITIGECLMHAALTTDQTQQNDNQLLQPRIQKSNDNMNEDKTAVRRLKRHLPLKVQHLTSESNMLPLKCQPPVSSFGDEIYRVGDCSKKFSGKSRSTDKNKKLRRPVIGSTSDCVTESSSEHQSLHSPKRAVRSARSTQSRPSMARVGSQHREDIEQSGVDADRSSSDECGPISNICDVTFVVESERGSSIEPLHARVDPMIAFTIAYDVDSSDCNSNLSTTPSNIASASVSSEIMGIHKLKSDEVQCESDQPVSIVQARYSCAPVNCTSKHTTDNVSFGILSDVRLRDNSLLPPSSKMSSSQGVKSTTPRDQIKLSLPKSNMTCVREKCIKTFGERLRLVSLKADADQSSISSVSSGSLDFCLSVADCVTSTPKLSPVSANACGLQAYCSKSCREFCNSDTHSSKLDDLERADAMMRPGVHDPRKGDRAKKEEPCASHAVEDTIMKANYIAAGTLKKSSGVIEALHQQVSEKKNNVGVPQNDGVCQSNTVAAVVGLVPHGADSDGRLSSSAQSLTDNDDNFEFDPFDDDNYLGSQLQLYRVSGAGEDLSSVKDGDMDIDDDMLLSSFGWLDNDSDDRLPPMSGELKSRTIRMLASRSDNCILRGAGEAFSACLPIEPRFSPEDIFFNWSFSSLGRPTSADSNASQAAVISVKPPSSLTTAAVIASISTPNTIMPSLRCSNEYSLRSAGKDSMTERIKCHQRDKLSDLDNVNG